eukprot:jgi/Botrbrau1/16175/Bobra.0377s0003.1
MNEKKLASKELSQSSILRECWSLELDGICKRRAIQPRASILMDQGSRMNNGDAANAVHSESPSQRAAIDNDTYKIPCSKDEVQGAVQGTMSKDQACRMQPTQLESFYYHGYLNKEYAIPRRIRAIIWLDQLNLEGLEAQRWRKDVTPALVPRNLLLSDMYTFKVEAI